MNILIEGTRGKSGLIKMITDCINARGESVIGKVTGLETAIFYKDKKIVVERKNKGFLIDKENKKILKKYKDVKFKVFENQGLSCYTMRAFHFLFKPDILVIPNIRFEHQDRLGETIEEQAKSFAVNFNSVKKIITTEKKKEVLDVFRRYCKKYGVEIVEINKEEKIPGINALYLTDEVIKIIFGKGLSKKEYQKYLKEIKSKMSIKKDLSKEIYFFKGSKLNDIESTRVVYEYLKNSVNNDFCFVCYLRKDRPERTEAFMPFFYEAVKDKKIKKIYVSGPDVNKIENHKKITKLLEKDFEEIFGYCKKNNLVFFTAINGVNPFMRNVELNLQEVKK